MNLNIFFRQTCEFLNLIIFFRQTCEFLNQILHTWPTHVLEKQIANLQDAIKRGINDADSEARAFSRK